MKNSFFATKTGKLSIAGIVVLLALPVIQIGVNSGPKALGYLGLAMIVGGMGFVPIYSIIDAKKQKS